MSSGQGAYADPLRDVVRMGAGDPLPERDVSFTSGAEPSGCVDLYGRRPAVRHAHGFAGESVVGYVPGAWDMFHIGHLNQIRQARALCDYLIVGVVPDRLIEIAKNKTPIVPTHERAAIVGAIRMVDEVFIESSPDKLVTWAEKPFDLFIKGDDWKGTPAGADLERRFAEVGVRVVYTAYTQSTSSSVLRERLLDA